LWHSKVAFSRFVIGIPLTAQQWKIQVSPWPKNKELCSADCEACKK